MQAFTQDRRSLKLSMDSVEHRLEEKELVFLWWADESHHADYL